MPSTKAFQITVDHYDRYIAKVWIDGTAVRVFMSPDRYTARGRARRYVRGLVRRLTKQAERDLTPRG